jgi:hypothetical protein
LDTIYDGVDDHDPAEDGRVEVRVEARLPPGGVVLVQQDSRATILSSSRPDPRTIDAILATKLTITQAATARRELFRLGLLFV